MQRTPARTFSPTSSRGRRRAGVVLAAAMFALPAMTGCAKVTGFNVETDKVYIPGNGANYRVASISAPVDVTGMVIVSGQDGSGTLIATFVNNDPEPATTPEMEPGEGVELTGYEPFEMDPNGFVNLAAEEWIAANDPVVVEAEEITPGASIPFVVGEGDDARQLYVPVVANTLTTTTQSRSHGEEGEGEGSAAGEGEGTEHGGHDDSHDESPNPWAGLDRSMQAQPARPTVDPTAGETEG